MISVIIPTLNEQSCIEATLEAVLAAPGAFEVIVADGHSDDATFAIASRCCRAIQCERGRAVQMNAGAREARGDVLLFLHADAIFPKTGFQSLQNALRDEHVIGGNFDLIFTGYGFATKTFTLINRWRRPFGIFYGDSGIFVRRKVFDKLGGFRPISLMEDYDFARRLIKTGKTVFVKDPLLVSGRRWEEHGLVRTMTLWFVLHSAYLLGVPARYLAPWYLPTRGKQRPSRDRK